ncbi:MAG: PTS sugar transporter subunit IIA [Anaerolineae bacterium]
MARRRSVGSRGPSALSRMLTADTVALRVRVRDWQEAVCKAGELLVNSAAVEPRYVEAMIRMVREIGPYIVIAPGIALPHARPEDGVNRPCMSLMTLDPPVCFGNAHNDPVSVVVAFGTSESEGHIKALAELARLLEDGEALERIKRSSSPDEILALVRTIGHGPGRGRRPAQ